MTCQKTVKDKAVEMKQKKNAKAFGTPPRLHFKSGTRFQRPTSENAPSNHLLLDAVPLLK
ncbi:hypothetical protein EDM54_07085 [Brevibacillus borstelensis]|nr:hypothetical protein X546_11315 [Brevibacillus borstelensis cifa_chp40]RNB64462.1 hypothetical protein EDM54_07085 [Brevibacillus borstelensis]